MELLLMQLLLMAAASLMAGFVDAIVGGCGLILVPALFAILPNAHPATLFGLDKSASIWGAGLATVQYAPRDIGARPGVLRRILRPGHRQLPGVPARARTGLRLPAHVGGRQARQHMYQPAALTLFAIKGHVWWHYAAALAAANVAGSLLGTRLALRHGAGFVRGVFILVVTALILKTGYDAFVR